MWVYNGVYLQNQFGEFGHSDEFKKHLPLIARLPPATHCDLRQLTVIQQFKIEWGQPFAGILLSLEVIGGEPSLSSLFVKYRKIPLVGSSRNPHSSPKTKGLSSVCGLPVI